MNEIDKKILSILQANADIPIAELSKKVNLSATPCWARINKLYKQGYIKKNCNQVVPPYILRRTIFLLKKQKNIQNLNLANTEFVGVADKFTRLTIFSYRSRS